MFSERRKKYEKGEPNKKKNNLQVDRYQDLVGRNKVCFKKVLPLNSESVQPCLTWKMRLVRCFPYVQQV
jgi:hypothetical protein